MKHILGGNLSEPIEPGSMSNPLLQYDQNQFFDGSAAEASFDDLGFYFVPPLCEEGSVQCKLHVFFHGCQMGYEFIGTDFIQTAGFLEVAEANNMIMLFPNVSKINLILNYSGFLVL